MSEPVNEESGDEEEVKKAKKPKPKKEKKLTKEACQKAREREVLLR